VTASQALVAGPPPQPLTPLHAVLAAALVAFGWRLHAWHAGGHQDGRPYGAIIAA
jgi:hypothetical protein